MSFSKLLVVGLDSAAPALVFERWRNELPTIADLIARGAHARLVSTNPPITVPAWTAMVSSHDPGELGFYGFRNRKDHSYDGYAFANSALVKVPRLWDWLGSAGLRCLVLGVPQTYPPSPLNGEMVSCFLTPSSASAYTYPPGLKAEVERVTDGYVLDVEDFRTTDKSGLLRRVYEKTAKHLGLAKHLLRTRAWDFCMLVEMGVDRIHHGFWSYMDRAHHRYEPGNPFESAILDYYRYVDRELAELLAACPPGRWSRSSRTTVPRRWTAASASTSGSCARAISRFRPRPPSRRPSPACRSTGRAPAPGATAATTGGSS